MSNKSIVNEIIKKSNELHNIQNEDNKKELLEDQKEKEEENAIIENDNSFKQLLSLQILIQKHSGLKELCKKNYLL